MPNAQSPMPNDAATATATKYPSSLNPHFFILKYKKYVLTYNAFCGWGPYSSTYYLLPYS